MVTGDALSPIAGPAQRLPPAGDTETEPRLTARWRGRLGTPRRSPGSRLAGGVGWGHRDGAPAHGSLEGSAGDAETEPRLTARWRGRLGTPRRSPGSRLAGGVCWGRRDGAPAHGSLEGSEGSKQANSGAPRIFSRGRGEKKNVHIPIHFLHADLVLFHLISAYRN